LLRVVTAISLNRISALAAIAALATACAPDRDVTSSAMPTAPSAFAPDGAGTAVARPAIVNFPGREDAVDFRRQLETKYATGLGRPPAQVYVDMEGEVVWIEEYDRYRVNGCDHTTATQYVLTQVDGAAPSPVCSVRYFPETAIYPPRNEVVDFRRQLGTKYQSMGRSAQSAVDAEGAAIWTAEYLRYRTSGCDHATATERTMTQIDGNPAPETCLTACVYHVSPQHAVVPSVGGTFTAQVYRASGACDYVALSESPWITLARPISGSGQGVQTYNVASNSGGPRTGWVRFQWPTGVTYLEVQQGTFNIGFQFFDPATSAVPTTECQLKTTTTTCTLTAAAQNLSSPIVSYSWRVQYAYGGTSKAWAQSSASPSFSFNESCSPSDPAGTPVPLSVTLTATDATGNSSTAVSGQGGQPALQLRSFTCP
jgi:hypothetical protein